MAYLFTRLFLSPFIRLFLGEVKGKNNIPNGPFIVASNHASFIDDWLIPYLSTKKGKRKFHIFVNSRFYKNAFFKMYLDHYECIPVDVSKDVLNIESRKKTNNEAFNKASEYLKKGRVFIIFPEGGRSKDGKLKKAKTGIAKVALSSKVPVIPIGIKGSYDIMPKGAKFPRLKKADVIIGKPLSFDKYYGKEKDYKTLNQVTTIIMQEIAKLTKQIYNY